jgi:simple sugar transport system permease protein
MAVAYIGFLVMLVASGGMAIFIYRSFAGFRLTVGGLAPLAARYAGFPVAKLYGLRC